MIMYTVKGKYYLEANSKEAKELLVEMALASHIIARDISSLKGINTREVLNMAEQEAKRHELRQHMCQKC